VVDISEKERRKAYLDAIKKRAEEIPELRRTIEETESHRVALTKEPEPDENKNKQKRQTQ
jgi:predicted ribosome quality control (RQC) complex YloA/Tae2 family protein